MREAASSATAIAAAVTRLATVDNRPGYAEAMQTEASGSRRAQLVALLVTVGASAAAVGVQTSVESVWVRIVVIAVMAVFVLFTILLAIGFAPTAAPEARPVVIAGLSRDADDVDHAELIDRNGGSTSVIYDSLTVLNIQPGDLGVAHLRSTTIPPVMLVEFRRL